MENTQDVLQVPLQSVHEGLGAKLIPFAGYLMPVRYSSDLEEHNCVRNAVGIFDVSHMGEFLILGKGSLELLQSVTSNDVSALVPGKAQYSCLPNSSGGIVDDIIVYMLAPESYMLIVNASNIDKDWNWIQKFNTNGVKMENISDKMCLFAIQGPKATACLQKLTSTDLSAIPYYHFAVSSFAGVENTFVSNTGYTGAGGFEVMVPNEHAETVWKKIMESGQEFGIKPIGLGARDTLRLEMGYCLYGNDIDDTTSPLEAGLGWITKFTKSFTNSAALQEQKTTGVKKKLVGIEMIDKGIARSHYELTNEKGEKIGEVTSGTQSPTLGKAIAMGYVQTEYAKPNTEIWVQVRGKGLKAQVVSFPFLKK